MSEPRLSRRESSTGLRRDTLASQNRKRSGSNASTSSRPSTLNPKGLGLTRKASTATLSVAPVSAVSAVEHSFGAGTEGRTGKARAEDALRFVQARAPVAPAALATQDEPKANSAPLAPIPDDATPPPPSTSAIPRPKSRASLIPVFRGSPERTKTLPGNAASSGTADKSPPTPKRTSTTSPPTSKFRSPGLARKPSTSSIRSHKPTSSSPLASLTTTAPALPKLDTASVSVQPPSVSDANANVAASPSSTSWLSSIRAITSKSAAAQDSPQIVISESPTAQEAAEKKPTSGLSVQTSGNTLAVSPKSSTGTSKSSTGTPTQAEFSTAPVSPVDSDNGLVLVDAPSPIQTTNGNGYRINELAAQHASNAAWSAINAPASWLAWMTAGSGPSMSVEGSGGGVEVMDIESDEEEAGRGLDKGKGKERPPHVTALSVDSVVPPLPEGDLDARNIHVRHDSTVSKVQMTQNCSRFDVQVGAVATTPPSLAIKPVSQNALSLNATALRYALQLPLLGRSRLQPADPQGEISPHFGQSAEGQPTIPQSENQAPGANGVENAKPGMIVTRYSDDHDFVIIEVEVDGWILIDTEGGLASPSTPMQGPSVTGRHGAGSNFWWDYYIGRTGYGPAAPGKVDDVGPAAEIRGGLSSPARSTEVTRDTDSVNSSLLTNVLRPFGRGKDAKAQPDGGSTAATATQNDHRETAQPPKTQAELIKEEALARQPPSVVPGLPSPVLNTATKSGWVSYFSSKASRSTPVMSDGRAVKQSAENAGEMEVMDIDEEDLSEPIEVQTSNLVPSTSAVQPRAAATGKPASPLTDSPSVKRKASVISQDKKSSASSSRSAKVSFPNLVLPTFGDTFYTVPRCMPPRAPTAAAGPASAGSWKLKRTVKNFSTMLFNTNPSDKALGPNVVNAEMEEYQRQAAERQRLTNRANFAVVEPAVPRSRASRPRPGNTRSTSAFGSLAIDDFGQDLPRVFSVLGNENALGDIGGPIRAAVIGVHGWFPGPLVRSVFGEPTGTSIKFATMGVDALRQFAENHGLNLESVTAMPLEGEGTIERRVTKADVVLVATHSQGSIVSTHLIARLISDGHIRTKSNREAVNNATQNTGVVPPIAPHRVCCLAMCGIHMGPLYSLNSSSLAQPYLQWFESQAARELFEFQNTESEVSRNYVAALSTALDHGTKFVYVASLNDQVVPIYSGTFVAASHPLILRGLFLDGDAYSSSDFLSNLLVLLLRVKNAGLDEHGLVVHLSEATAGSLSGIGHSTAYEDAGPYTLAVRYMFETSDLSPDTDYKLSVDAFEARASRNDYEIPWLLHSVISDTRIGRIFSAELAQLRESFGEWKPTTAVLRDIQRKLAPIRMSPLRHSMIAPPQESATSKL